LQLHEQGFPLFRVIGNSRQAHGLSYGVYVHRGLPRLFEVVKGLASPFFLQPGKILAAEVVFSMGGYNNARDIRLLRVLLELLVELQA
jgi:hypothetical protein